MCTAQGNRDTLRFSTYLWVFRTAEDEKPFQAREVAVRLILELFDAVVAFDCVQLLSAYFSLAGAPSVLKRLGLRK
jgi:hypothetical protein